MNIVRLKALRTLRKERRAMKRKGAREEGKDKNHKWQKENIINSSTEISQLVKKCENYTGAWSKAAPSPKELYTIDSQALTTQK